MSQDQKHAANVQNQFIFESGSINTIIKDNTFNGAVTIHSGDPKGLPVTDQRIKEALERLDSEGVLVQDVQWWAIYRVLTMPRFGLPSGKGDFCKCIDNMEVHTRVACKYDNWRKVSVHKLTASPEHWHSVENLGTAEESQRRVGLRLLELLDSPPS